MRNITHDLHPGAMHYDAGYIKVQLSGFRLASSRPMTYIYIVAPRNLFAWRVAHWYRYHFSPSMMIRKKLYLTRAVLPALLLDQTLQFRRAVT